MGDLVKIKKDNYKEDQKMRNFTITIGASELATVWTDPDFATRGYSNVARPEFGSDWQLRFQIQFLFPK